MANPVRAWFDRLLYGSVSPVRGAVRMPVPVRENVPARTYTSHAFNAHVLEKANYATATRNPKSPRGNLAISNAWDQTEGAGISPSQRLSSAGILTEFDRKETLLQAYLQNAWVSSCVDVIAKRITSGGFVVEPVKSGEGDETNRDTIKDFLLLINDNWDFLQLVRSIITDLLIFGEAYVEIVWQGGKPFQLHKVDCPTITYKLDKYGNILGYEQQLAHTTKTNPLDPDDIIRWWLPSPYANMIALSPIERCLDAVNIDKKMVNFVTSFFQKGAKAPFWVETKGDEDEATRFLEWFRENFTGEKNAHLPFTTYGETQLHEFQKGAIDIDFPTGRKMARDEVLTVYNVPPAIVGIIETGNIGSGSGESQEKSFQYNTCDPIKQLIFEKFNFRIIWKGFQIRDHMVSTRYADYRNDKDVADVQDKHIRNGSITIDEARSEMGKEAYKDGGGDIAVIVTTKEITPVPRLLDLEEESRQTAQQNLAQGALNTELLKAKVAQAKESPQPVPVALQQASTAPDGGNPPTQQDSNPPVEPTQSTVKKASNIMTGKTKPATESLRPEVVEQHTGVMVALYPSAEAAQSLAIPGGEPANALHLTLAFLGDSSDMPDDAYNPACSPYYLKAALADYAFRSRPLSGYITGVNRFAGDDESYPVIATPEVPMLHTWREGLVQAIQDAGYKVDMTYTDYTPHITLAYVPQGEPAPIDRVPNIALNFDTLWLVIGEERFPFKFGEIHPEALIPVPAQTTNTTESAQKDVASQIAAVFTDIEKRGRKALEGESA